jgi:lipopolysaccharide transport system permease protein
MSDEPGVAPTLLVSGRFQAAREVAHLIRRVVAHRRVLLTVARLDFRQRYAGSFLGSLWYPVYWGMLLGMYCFVYVVIFRQRLPEFGEFGYVLFILAGLVPYFGISDAISSGTASVRSNIAFHRNAVFPIELVPVKTVLVALGSQAVAVAIVVVVAVSAGYAGWHLLYLPVPFVLELLLVTGAVWALSVINVMVPDVQQGVTLGLWFLLFVSPVGFTLGQVPPGYRWLLWLNPLTYLIEEFRFALLGVRTIDVMSSLPLLTGLAIAVLFLGAVTFQGFIAVIGDYV